MHWTSHMDQYDILSHPQDQSPLPYLISSQPTNDPLPLRRSPPRPGPDPLAASLVPPTETRSAQHQWSTGVPAYGKDPSWRSQQISFLHAEQKRHTGKFEPPLMSDDYATSSGRSAQYPQAEHAPRLMQYATGDGMQRSVSDSRKRKSDSDHQERRGRASQEHSIPGQDVLGPDALPTMDRVAVAQRIPAALQRYFEPPSTKQQPHLDVLRERKKTLERNVALGHPEALAEVQEAHAAKRRTAAQGLLTPEEKKANHIASEQKRRANIRKGYDMLCDALPSLHNRQGDGDMDQAEDGEGRSNAYSELTILEEATDILEQRLREHHELLLRKAQLQSHIAGTYNVPMQMTNVRYQKCHRRRGIPASPSPRCFGTWTGAAIPSRQGWSRRPGGCGPQ